MSRRAALGAGIRSRTVRGLAFLVLALSALGSRPVVRIDNSWRAPDLRPDTLVRVALLPLCRVAGDARTSRQIEDAWLSWNPRVGRSRLDAVDCLRGLGASRSGGDPLFDSAMREIMKGGRPTPETARELARRLEVTALISLRLDRWEIGSGSVDMAYVGLTAALVDSSGSLLWRSTGRAHAERQRPPTRMPGLVQVTRGTDNTLLGAATVGSASSGSGSSGGSTSPSSSGSTSAPPSSGASTQPLRPQATMAQPPSLPLAGGWSRQDAPFAAALDALIRALAVQLAGDSAGRAPRR